MSDEALRALEKKWRKLAAHTDALVADLEEDDDCAWNRGISAQAVECADELAAILSARQEVAPVAVPEGWALVPQQMTLTPESLGFIETMCAGPDNEGIGGEGGEDRWLDGILWVGETIGDNGEKYWGLNIACSDLLDEGSIPVCEFERPTSARLCDFFADVGEVEQFMDDLCNVVTELTGDEGEDDPITVLRRYITSPAQTSEARDDESPLAQAFRRRSVRRAR